ncbi:DUF4465 domain-containing protein [Rhodopirellula sallentina]|nr:DUF4465 domain-containing protein [Rhodopirellula sallentina]
MKRTSKRASKRTVKRQRTQPFKRRLLMQGLEDRRLLAAGPYAPAAGEDGSTAIAFEDSAIVGWASAVADYSPGSDVDAQWTDTSNALGPAEGEFDGVVSLGRGGSITLEFATPIRDGLGADFAVFENAINDTFLELAFVEVSSDGVNFVRFDSDSLTPAAVPSYGEVDPTQIDNLAGKYRGGYGTPFDLEELRGTAGLDVTSVTHVRLVDIVGDGLTVDSDGDPIYDPTPTFGSAGLDLDAIGVIHQVEYGEVVVDFETLGSGLPAEGTDNGSSGAGVFAEDEISLNSNYDTQWQSWTGWSISKSTDAATAGFGNQFGNITGGGYDGSDTFAVGFFDVSPTEPAAPPTITLDPASASRFDSLYVTNTTYTALSMLSGDSFAKKFGGDSGDEPDFLQLTITGVDASGNPVGDVSVMLGDYRFEDNSQDTILDKWTRVDVSSLSEARSLQFSMTSSDNGSYGMNTPAFFAVDDVTLLRAAVPMDLETDVTSEDESVTARVSRPTEDSSSPVDVNLQRTGTDQATLPESVTIPVGAAYVEFEISPTNDDVPTDSRELEVTATVETLLPTTRSLVIEDDETLAISFDTASLEAVEGEGERTLTLRRNDADLDGSLEVTLSHDLDGVLSVPTSVQFDAGVREVDVTIEVLDDEVFGGGSTGVIHAVSGSHEDAEVSVSVSEDDFPKLVVDPVSFQLSENSPEITQMVTVSRNTVDTTSAVIVSLSLPGGGPLMVPNEVVIPAGNASATFTVEVIDDTIDNLMSSYVVLASNENFVSSSVEVNVVDNDTASLQIELQDLSGDPLTEVSEAEPFQVLVRRVNASLDVAQEVTISTTLGDRVSGAGTVVIPIGSDSVTHTMQVIGDGIVTGPLTVGITAVAQNVTPVAVGLTVSETDQPTLSVVAPEDGLSEADAIAIGDFELLGRGLVDGEFDNNAGASGRFVSGPVSLNNSFSNSFGFDFWSGFSISRANDTATPGFGNQYSAITGSGANGSSTYAVAYAGSPALISRDGDQPFESIEITNTTYAALSMRDGDAFAKKFGGETGDDADFLLLTIDGLDSDGNSIGQVEFYLADYRFDDNSLDYIVDEWMTVDVSPIGDAEVLSMSLSSSDNGSFGMNTPAYFAVDNVMLTPNAETLPTISISRNTADTSQAIEVQLGSDRDELIVPMTVVIPEGESSVDVPVAWIDNALVDALIDGERQWNVTAMADGFVSGAAEVSLLEDDTETLTLTLFDETASEADGVQLVDFEDIGSTLLSESFNNGSDGMGGFTAESFAFPTDYNPVWGSWSGWALSNVTDVTTAGFGNQFSAYANVDASEPGGGAEGSDTFAIAGGYGASPLTIAMPDDVSGATFESISITNTTYAALSMRDGDFFAKQFGGEDGTDPDYFLLTIEGLDASGESVGEIDFYLADYRFEDDSLDYIVDDWTTVDLSSLSAASSLQFSFESSDVGEFGMNTPAFFAIDNLLIDRSATVPSMVVHRNDADTSEPLEVTLASSSPSRLSVPDSIVIPAGVDSVRVPVVLSDDAEYGDDLTVQVTASAEGFAGADGTIEIFNDDLPAVLTLEHDGVNHLVGTEFDVVIDEYDDDSGIDLLFSNASQQFTLNPVDAASVTVRMSGGSDSAWLHTKGFNQVDGGAGVDTAVIAPGDLDEAEAVDVAAWLNDRVIGFETVVLGTSDVADAGDPLTFDLDLDELSQVNGGTLPLIVSTTGQTLRWTGDWRLGEMTMVDGKLSAAVTSGDVSVQVATDEAWRNFVLAQDVNASGGVTATDALVIINRLNADPSFELPDPQSTDDLTGVYYDVSGDGLVTALDALQVINWLNENDGGAPSSEPSVDLLAAESMAGSPVVTPAEEVESNDKWIRDAERIADAPVSLNTLSIEAVSNENSGDGVEAVEIGLDAAANRIDPVSVDVAMSELELLSTSDSLQSELRR